MTLLAPGRATPSAAGGRGIGVVLCYLIAGLAGVSSTVGLLRSGGPGPHDVATARGQSVTVYGEGLYAADSWLVGAGNRGQDLVMLLVEIPVLLLVLRRFRPDSAVGRVAVTGVLAFFAYYYTSMTFGTAQNRLFPLYIVLFGLSVLALVRSMPALDTGEVARQVSPYAPRRRLIGYLLAVGAALVLAWLPDLLATSLDGDIAERVGPYTSSATHALDLGLVVPVVAVAAFQLVRRTPAGLTMALVVLVLNVLIGVLLIGQSSAQLLAGVPLTAGELIGKVLSFVVLTGIAGGLLLRMAFLSRRPASVKEGENSEGARRL